MKIELKNQEPVKVKPYRTAFAKRPIMAKVLSNLLNAGVISHSTSPYASPVLLVPKSEYGEYRLCVDYRLLNAITVKEPYPMAVIEEMFAQMSGNSWFTTLDFNMGYDQIEVDEDSKPFTAFVTTDRHYQYNRMPFGLVNAPAVMIQETINGLIAKLPPRTAVAYLDDVIVPSQTVTQGISKLEDILKLLESTNLTLRYEKCKFLSKSIAFLGHQVSGEGIKPGVQKTAAITNFKTPKNVTEVRRFLGLTGFFRKFVEHYALIAKPLTALIKKEALTDFRWGSEQETAFRSLIAKLTSAPILALYDFNSAHEVHCDASHVGVRAVLLQSASGLTNWQAVFYFSRQCTDSETRYHSYELEFLAVVEALRRFRIYLLGKHFKVVTDCYAVTGLKANVSMNPRVSRWWMNLSEYDFEFEHRAQSRMQHVDAMSRAPITDDNIEHYTVATIKMADDDWLYTMQWQDATLRNIIEVLNGTRKSAQEKQLKHEYCLIKGRLYRRNDDRKLYVVPKAVRGQIVRFHHDEMEHFGLENTLKRIKQKFWFPRARKYVKEHIAACVECCYSKTKTGKIEGQLYIEPMEPVPFRVIHIDHLGPFKKSKRGFMFILAMSDGFTKYLVVKPVRNTKTQPVLSALNELSGYFGLPQIIISDRGTAFTSAQFENFCMKSDIHHIKIAVRTPRANGQVERANQTILQFLKTTVENENDWDEKLRDLQWCVNSQANATTKFTPNELVFDFPLRDVVQNRLLAAVMSSEMQQNITEKRNIALENIKTAREKWKKRFDRKHRTPHTYTEGNLVVLRSEAQATGESRKLVLPYRGPSIVDKAIGKDRYLIKDMDGLQHKQKPFSSIYSAEHLKPWCSMPPELLYDSSDEEDGHRDDD